MIRLSDSDKAWTDSVCEKLIAKMKPVTGRNGDKIPYTAKNGVFDDWSADDKIGWWTNGFFGGIMWDMFDMTGDDTYLQVASKLEDKLDKVLMNPDALDHDNGFRWLPTAVRHYRYDSNEMSYKRMILAAENLCGRFNLAGNFFRAWNNWDEVDRRGIAIIDCMMNLPLLYIASNETTDPRFKQMAMAHADTVIKAFVREDGSVCHIVRFDPFNGDRIESLQGQGYAHGSSWTRGQSWGLYGFVQSYNYTHEVRYLHTAERIANYILANIPKNFLIPVDYKQPADVTLEDTTASAITACGLIELAKALMNKEQPLEEKDNNSKERDARLYLDTAISLLKTLDEKRINWSSDIDNLLEKCTAAYDDKEHEFPIIYGDYYFIEAVKKLEELK